MLYFRRILVVGPRVKAAVYCTARPTSDHTFTISLELELLASFPQFSMSSASPTALSSDLSKLNVSQLKAICKERRIVGYSKLGKAALICKLAEIAPSAPPSSSTQKTSKNPVTGSLSIL